MDRAALSEHLSRISTLWTMVFEAHRGGVDAAAAAQHRLLQRYSGAAYRFLLGVVRDPDVAQDLCQEFALRLVRGDFRRADPGRGRFRDYLKSCLRRLVPDHHRASKHWPQPLPAGAEEAAAHDPNSGDDDAAFLASWREGLLDRTWAALAEANAAYHAVLLCRVDEPELSSAQIAERVTARLGKPVNAAWVRKTLQRAQEKYADLLIDEVAQSLETEEPAALRQELEELDLLRYCRSALERRAGQA
jgi:RNA polymerase sigma-70 factor (ECF subfamily)